MYILLSGNPPFYEEADEDDYENHDKNLFRKILAGDYEFDPPYWDDISQAGEPHIVGYLRSWISGNAASDKNIKDGVCAQIEKNFARAKWKVGVGVPCLRVPSQPSPVTHHGAMSLVGLPGMAPHPRLRPLFYVPRRRAGRGAEPCMAPVPPCPPSSLSLSPAAVPSPRDAQRRGAAPWAARPAALVGRGGAPRDTRACAGPQAGPRGRSGGRPGDPLSVPGPPGGTRGPPRVVPGGPPLPPPCPLPGPRFPPRSCMPAGPALPAAAAAAPRPAAVSLANKDPAEDKLRQHQRRLPSLSVGPGVCYACRQHGAE
uniref:Protein kinase domain-containing protein n=1 Tax=Catharus ustulatus TaxID=91951 RepID=A0A8C3VF94_CATUS